MKTKYIDHYGIDSLPQLQEASESECSYFVTTNEAMLKDREELEKRFNMKIRTPSEMLKEKIRPGDK